MSEQKHGLLRHGLLALGGLTILMLIVLFYATVSGAVDRAAHRRAESVDNLRLSAQAGALPAAPRLAALRTASR